MTTKAAAANGMSRTGPDYLSRIADRFRDIKAIHKDIARQRAEGRMVSAQIRRQQKEIQTILDRVEATL